jgi:histidyl-tRNA synthetase
LDDDSRSRLESNPLRILDSKNRDTQDLLESAPRLIDALGSDSRERFERVQQGLQELGIPFRLNPRLVRGLDYYGHTAFEITSDQLGAQATVCGGGRYNGLVEQLGGAATPAIGWALGLERLMLVLEAAAAQDPSGSAASLTASQPPDLFVVNRGDQAEAAALVLARSLRSTGLSVELDGSGAAFAKQFKRADRSGARWALVLGDDEVSRDEIRLKPLQAKGEERCLPLNDHRAVVEALMNT